MDSGHYTGSLIAGRYLLRREIGAGGMGVVYEAWQEDLRRPVAVKLLTAASRTAITRFEREAQAAAALGHPHIVQVLDFGVSQGQPPYLVMELLSGSSLAELVRREGVLSAERARRLGVQVLSALEAAHAVGIFHRDIKPANLFVTQTATLGEVAKVLDFGIAKVAGPDTPSLTQTGGVVGTLSYMAPEQAAGLEVDGRADVYSLAATLHFACSGSHPSPVEPDGRGAPRLDQLLPGFDPSFADVVQRGLARDRAQRFQSAREMADALGGELGGVAAAASRGPTSAPTVGSRAQSSGGALLAGGPEPTELASQTSVPLAPTLGGTLAGRAATPASAVRLPAPRWPLVVIGLAALGMLLAAVLVAIWLWLRQGAEIEQEAARAPKRELDFRRFDASAFLPRANEQARQYFADAELTSLTVPDVDDSGLADLVASQGYVGYGFRARGSGQGDADAGVAIGDCVTNVVVSRNGVVTTKSVGNCNAFFVRAPRCSTKQVMDKALAKPGQRANLTYTFDYLRGPVWFVAFRGTNQSLVLPDDC